MNSYINKNQMIFSFAKQSYIMKNEKYQQSTVEPIDFVL